MEKHTRTRTSHDEILQSSNPKKLWDCDSTLYDSFELNSFKRQLDSAIANSSRTLSMPHLSDRRVLTLQPPPSSTLLSKSKKPFKISRSLHKLLRSVFKPNNNKSSRSSSSVLEVPAQKSKDRYYVVYDKSGPVLSTIPEVPPEFENIAAISPEINSFVRARSASERFTPTSIGI
ncbi:putative serine/threonine-protein kinase pats1 [Senna tora]|uniref:Putative serine/threonine-protein kinase pats1 n=1 Tax=Senna tora TaxID=362788 RepID=A0A834TXM6_9FABA|nr:putative serine/threonine-protein kinase pats1 [Senna tora]